MTAIRVLPSLNLEVVYEIICSPDDPRSTDLTSVDNVSSEIRGFREELKLPAYSEDRGEFTATVKARFTQAVNVTNVSSGVRTYLEIPGIHALILCDCGSRSMRKILSE